MYICVNFKVKTSLIYHIIADFIFNNIGIGVARNFWGPNVKPGVGQGTLVGQLYVQ